MDEFFNFTKGQRRGILLFALIVAAALFIAWM